MIDVSNVEVEVSDELLNEIEDKLDEAAGPSDEHMRKRSHQTEPTKRPLGRGRGRILDTSIPGRPGSTKRKYEDASSTERDRFDDVPRRLRSRSQIYDHLFESAYDEGADEGEIERLRAARERYDDPWKVDVEKLRKIDVPKWVHKERTSFNASRAMTKFPFQLYYEGDLKILQPELKISARNYVAYVAFRVSPGVHYVIDIEGDLVTLATITHHERTPLTEAAGVTSSWNPFEFPISATLIDMTARPALCRYYLCLGRLPAPGTYRLVHRDLSKKKGSVPFHIYEESFYGRQFDVKTKI